MYTIEKQRAFLNGYIDAALWSSTTGDGTPLDKLPVVRSVAETRDALADACWLEMARDCAVFIELNHHSLTDLDPARAGHDLWLTRNGHGAGFWDRGLGDVGERLTESAKVFGEVDLYLGDDNLIHSMSEGS